MQKNSADGKLHKLNRKPYNMTTNKFKKVLSEYILNEAGEDAAAAPSAAPDAGGAAPPPDAAGGAVPPPDAGGMPDLGGLGGGGGMPDLGGGDPNAAAPGGGESNTLCSKKYVALISYLCELYNADVSNNRNMVLNLKVKVGDLTTLNDVHNADEVFEFMVMNLLEEDIIKEVKKNIKKADKQIKELKKSGEYQSKTILKANSTLLKEVVSNAYYAVCSNANEDDLPEINYGVSKDFPVDPKNAKAVFDEIKTNIEQTTSLSEDEA